MSDVFDIALTVLIAAFILGIIWVLGVNIIGENIYPMMTEFNVSNNTQGISSSQYTSILDKLKDGTYWFFYVIIAVPLVYIAVRLLYKREPTSVYDYG